MKNKLNSYILIIVILTASSKTKISLNFLLKTLMKFFTLNFSVREKQGTLRNYFINFNIRCIYAERSSHFGRGIFVRNYLLIINIKAILKVHTI